MRLMMAKTMRRMRAQGIYYGRDTPEVQFCKKVAERKDAEVRAARKEAKLRYKQDYVIKVYMHELDPPIWRRFKMPGGIVLNTFADKVLMPIMGWVRNFHGYVFIDRKDGCLFGPKGSNAIDITCHLARSYYYYMDDKEYKLGDLLTERGARLGWLYDLGDGWRHEVEVEDIRSESESTGTCKLLDGAGRCPPENGRGNWEYQETINILKIGRGRQYQSALEECSNGPNVKPRTFDFREFDLAERRRELKHALASPGSTQSGSKLYTHNLHPFDWEDVGPPRPKAKKGEKRVEREGADVFSPTLTETISTKADKVALSLCADCGRPEALYKCGRCRVVRYCSRECQSRHWKDSHKRACDSKK